MERSRFIAKLLGPVCIAGGAGMLFNTTVFKAMFERGLHDHLLIYVAGLIALVSGLAIVILHNRWDWNWTVIVTLFGWLAVIGGIVRMVAPQLVEQWGLQIIAYNTFFLIDGWIAVLLGVLLSYFGYLEPASLSPARGSSSRRRRR
ncbi:MAG TPA: hypothetical protein VFB31_12770 [Pseudolabrys sp.]|nr:hypothetical protein [Pseudolabrys sp.]